MKQRVQIDMSPRAVGQLDAIQKATDASSRAEVIRNALKVYGYIVDQKRRGVEVTLLKKTKDEEIEVSLLDVGL